MIGGFFLSNFSLKFVQYLFKLFHTLALNLHASMIVEKIDNDLREIVGPSLLVMFIIRNIKNYNMTKYVYFKYKSVNSLFVKIVAVV